MSVIEFWLHFCKWLRSQTTRISRDKAPHLFGLFFPGMWRGKSHFSPVRSVLFKRALGDHWYERIYEWDLKAIWLDPQRFQEWKNNLAVQECIRQNIEFFLHHPHLSERLTAVGWAKCLQNLYDFQLLQEFEEMWNACNRRTWSPDQLALFYSIH